MLGQASYDAAARELLRRRAKELHDAYERRHLVRDGYFYHSVPCDGSVRWMRYRHWVSEWLSYCENVRNKEARE